jgi:AcrR family transcriptional regulator
MVMEFCGATGTWTGQTPPAAGGRVAHGDRRPARSGSGYPRVLHPVGVAAANGPAPAEPVNRALQAEGKRDTQRERLLAAIVHVTAEHGYEHATIARVITHAGVSRPTFYDYFPGRVDCFLAALGEIEARVLAEIRLQIAEQPPQHATAAATGALLGFSDREPAAARLLTNETLAGGPRVLRVRDETIAAAGRMIEDAYRELADDAVIPDVPAEILLGAVHRLLASRLRRGERGLLALKDDLLDWAAAYAHPAGEHRWRTLSISAPPARSPFIAEAPLRAPPPLPPGRPRRAASTVAENHRLRIMFATAKVVQREGYLQASVAQITRVAGLDGRVFYELFADKQDAFMAVHELGFQRAMAVTAGAFFAGEDWPARIWEAGRAFTGHLEQNPTLTHASLIESHAGGPETVQRFEDLMAGFTIFLQEGYQYEPNPQRAPPSALALEAVGAANVEAVYRQARTSANPKMTGLLPHLTYMCLAPFVGPVTSGELIEELINTDGQLHRPSPEPG